MFEDNAEYVTGIWAAMAQHISVPTVILPFTIADQLEAAEAHYNDPTYWADEGVHNRLARLIRPQWLYFHRDRWLLRREGIAALAAECLGVAPPLPWVLNSSRADAIAVESDAKFRTTLYRIASALELLRTQGKGGATPKHSAASAAIPSLRNNQRSRWKYNHCGRIRRAKRLWTPSSAQYVGSL